MHYLQSYPKEKEKTKMSNTKEFWIVNSWFELALENGLPKSYCMYVFGADVNEFKLADDDVKYHVIEKSAYNQAIKERDKVLAALEELAESVDDSLLLDENLHKDWDKLREAVIKARKVIGEV